MGEAGWVTMMEYGCCGDSFGFERPPTGRLEGVDLRSGGAGSADMDRSLSVEDRSLFREGARCLSAEAERSRSTMEGCGWDCCRCERTLSPSSAARAL